MAHPTRNAQTIAWLENLLQADIPVILPEIVDYEIRRSFLLEGLTRSLVRLDSLCELLIFHPINSAAMRKAAELWAEARRHGQPTADPRELDSDVILASQALQLRATVATENIGHLARFVPARNWREIRPE
jgi:predicted nucleic acid-binding protein